MSELGQLLKEARKEKGLSLDDVQEITKIQKRYLKAIEDGNYAILPGSFYVRGFIKNYAEAVGLEPESVLQLYRNAAPAPENEPVIEQPIRKRRSGLRSADRVNKWLSGLLMWSFVILIIGLIYYFVNVNYKTDESPSAGSEEKRITEKTDSGQAAAVPPAADSHSSTDKVAVPPAENPPVQEEKPKPDVKLSRTENGIDYYTVSNTDKISLEMKVTGDKCWIQVDELLGNNKKDTKEAKNIVQGETRSWDLGHSVHVLVGKANAIEITVNGTSIPVGDLPNPKHFQFELQTAS